MKRRNTKHKEKILKEFETNHILDAAYFVSRFSDIDPATIYRNLSRFVEDGILKEVNLDGKVMHYELKDRGGHFHALCEDCGKVESVEFKVASLEKKLNKKFHIEDLTIKGRCADCS